MYYNNIENHISFFNLSDVLYIQSQDFNIGVKRRFFTILIDRYSKLLNIFIILKKHNKNINIIKNIYELSNLILNMIQSLFKIKNKNPNISINQLSLQDIDYIYQTSKPLIINSICLLSKNKIINFPIKINQHRNELLYYSDLTNKKILNYNITYLLRIINNDKKITIYKSNSLIKIEFELGWMILNLIPYEKDIIFWSIYDIYINKFNFNENSKREFYLFVNNSIYKLIFKYSIELLFSKYNISKLFIDLVYKGLIFQIFKQINLTKVEKLKLKFYGNEFEGYFEIIILVNSLENSLKGKIFIKDISNNIKITNNYLSILIDYQSIEWRLSKSNKISKIYSEYITLDIENYENLYIKLLKLREPTLLMITLNKLKYEFIDVFNNINIVKISELNIKNISFNFSLESKLGIYLDTNDIIGIIYVKFCKKNNNILSKLKLKYNEINKNNIGKFNIIKKINDILIKI